MKLSRLLCACEEPTLEPELQNYADTYIVSVSLIRRES